MIHSSAPLRLSFSGGGSDYKDFYDEYGGAVFGSAIDKRVHVFINNLALNADENFRFTYRKTESVQRIEDMEHPVAREAIRYFKIKSKVNIATMADIPGKSGLGSSSAFTVALVAGLARYSNIPLKDNELVKIAYKIEREIINEAGGIQDHLHATYGGMRLYKLKRDNIEISESILNRRLRLFSQNNMILIKIGGPRNSSDAATKTVTGIQKKTSIEAIRKSADLAINGYQKISTATKATQVLEAVSHTVNENWIAKVEFQDLRSTTVNDAISNLMSAGASAIKVSGAGESGYLLVFGDRKFLGWVNEKYEDTDLVRFKFSNRGVLVSNLI